MTLEQAKRQLNIQFSRLAFKQGEKIKCTENISQIDYAMDQIVRKRDEIVNVYSPVKSKYSSLLSYRGIGKWRGDQYSQFHKRVLDFLQKTDRYVDALEHEIKKLSLAKQTQRIRYESINNQIADIRAQIGKLEQLIKVLEATQNSTVY